MKDGSVMSFGRGEYGQLGHGDTTNQLSPKAVAGLGTNAQTCSAGSEASTRAHDSTILPCLMSTLLLAESDVLVFVAATAPAIAAFVFTAFTCAVWTPPLSLHVRLFRLCFHAWVHLAHRAALYSVRDEGRFGDVVWSWR
jgi:hypothetical protein